MESGRKPSRRALLTGAAAMTASAGLAACTRRAVPTELGSSGSGIAPTGTAASSSTASASASAGTSAPAARPTLASLSQRLSTPLIEPRSVGYPSAARLYNPRFDATSKPAAIARCRTADDVASCVRFAAESDLPMALRAGGHSYGGWSSSSGLVVDVATLNSVVVDTSARTARFGAGARLIDAYQALSAKGVAIAGGSCPTVGLTGLLLGGGVGVLSRQFGLTCDALRAATVVTADGRIRTVDARHDPDLFWALRGGGGGSFAAVLDLTLAVQPAPTVHTFFLEWDFGHAATVLTAWMGWVSRADRRLWSTCKLLADPRTDGLHVTVSGTWIGPSNQLDAALAPLVNGIAAPTTVNQRSTLDYLSAMFLEAGCYGQTAAQCVAAGLSSPLRQPFAATSAILGSPLPASGVSTAIAQAQAGLSVPGIVEGGMSFDALGGAISTLAPGDTAFVHRDALASIQYTATWPAPAGPSGTSADPSPFDRYVRRERAALAPWTGPSAYVNYADPSISAYGEAYWGANYPRLRAVKRAYDPAELFRFPQSVRP